MRKCKTCSLFSRSFGKCRLTKMNTSAWMACTAGFILHLTPDELEQAVYSLT